MSQTFRSCVLILLCARLLLLSTASTPSVRILFTLISLYLLEVLALMVGMTYIDVMDSQRARKPEPSKIMTQFLYCLVIFSALLNTVFRKAENTTEQYIKIKFDLKRFCDVIHRNVTAVI